MARLRAATAGQACRRVLPAVGLKDVKITRCGGYTSQGTGRCWRRGRQTIGELYHDVASGGLADEWRCHPAVYFNPEGLPLPPAAKRGEA